MSSDADLKLSDTLRYYERDTQAALVRERERKSYNIDYVCIGPAV